MNTPMHPPRASRLLGVVLATLVAMLGAGAAEARVRVVAAITDLGAIAEAVGGDHVEIEVVARPDRNPHAVEIRPSTMRKTARADVYLEAGLSLDPWSRGIIDGSRNRELVVVDCSSAIVPLEVPTGPVDASMGDVHPDGNPHYWLDPVNGVAVARHVAEVFATHDAAHAATYRTNADAFATRIAAASSRWSEMLAGRSFIEYHRTWVYFATRFGMTIADTVEPFPGIPPSARHLAALVERIRADAISRVVYDVYHDPGPVEFLARETGVVTTRLTSMCARPTAESYLENLERAATAFGVADAETP